MARVLKRLREWLHRVLVYSVGEGTSRGEMDMRAKGWTVVMLSVLFLLPATLAAQSGPSAEEDSEEKAIVRLLSHRHDFPERDELLAVSEHAPQLLIRIYRDEEHIPSLRGRALDALGFFKTEETEVFFNELFEQQALPSRDLHHAVTAYSKAFGEGALTRTAPFLEHEDLQIRLTVVEALEKHCGEAGRQLLEARLKVEAEPLVRERLEAATRRSPL